MNGANSLKEQALRYQPGKQTVSLVNSLDFLTVSSIVSAGKNSVVNLLVGDGFGQHVISHTTRQPRASDQTDAYHYVSRSTFADMLVADQFLEAAPVHDDFYGTSVAAMQQVVEAGQRPLMEIDIQGVASLKRAGFHFNSFFITPPDTQTWLGWWAARDPETTEAQFMVRVQSARDEIAAGIGMARDNEIRVVVNYTVKETAQRIMSLTTGDGDRAAAEVDNQQLLQFGNQLAAFSSAALWKMFQKAQN